MAGVLRRRMAEEAVAGGATATATGQRSTDKRGWGGREISRAGGCVGGIGVRLSCRIIFIVDLFDFSVLETLHTYSGGYVD